MKLTEKLLKLGFELGEYYGKMAYVYRTERNPNMRFIHEFVYYPDENQFYINCYKTRSIETITEDELIRDHNDLNTPAKEQWLEIKTQLKDHNFNIYGGVKK